MQPQSHPQSDPQPQPSPSPKPLKFLALISGGKDSIFNIQKCLSHGHTLIALANLYNYDVKTQTEGTESDSYMYQTVGSNVTVGIAEALGKPIYRRRIGGKPRVTGLGYEGDAGEKVGDEVEDLYELVVEVLKKHPEIDAISSGAIYSTYQKLRVQDICKRLGLTSLAYLWHRNQAQLLQQMISYPLDAIIIKIASYGLKPSHLGQSITQLQPYFLKLEQECGMNVCGEGGEYESLVVDCSLYWKKIVMCGSEEWEVVEVERNQIAPVAYLRIRKFRLQDK